MHTLLKLPNARKVVTQLGQVTPGMNVLVLYDYYTAHNVEPLSIALQEAGAQAHLLQIAGSAHHGTQFSEVVAQAMRASGLVIALTRANAAHTEARQQATRNGVGVIVLPESDAADFFVAPGWNADFDTLRLEIEGLAHAFTQATRARVTSPDGTDVTMSVAGRTGRALHGFANTTDISAGYCLESSLAPVEGTANGIIMVNASIPGVGVVRDAPVRIEMKDGMAVSITGGELAEKFRNLLASFDDPNVYNLGELGVGMNPCCSIDGTMLSDESVYGAIQLALGTSAYIGGTVKAAAHYDTIVTNATLELDGRAVLVGTRLMLGESA
ncbi:MAG: hypothetical protein WC590_08820 [Burkholderiaceae bacterium]